MWDQLNREGGQKQHAFNEDSKKSDFSPRSLCLGRIAKLCSCLIIVADFASASRVGMASAGSQCDAAKAVSMPLLRAGSLETLLQ